jgi:hypothetical protein
MRALILFVGLALCGCDDDGSSTDAAPAADASVNTDQGGVCNSDLGAQPSACGRPCDTGNSLGVGKFCLDKKIPSDDCKENSKATLCSSIQNGGGPNDSYVCTFPCTAGQTDCGENAHCECNGGPLCGCIPNRCGAGMTG